MRRIMIIALAVLLTLGFVTAGLAQMSAPGGEGEVFEEQMALAKTVSFEGTVLSHDVICHCVVVKTATGNLTFQDDYAKFHQEYNRLKGLKIGSTVKGEFKTVNFINYALRVSYK